MCSQQTVRRRFRVAKRRVPLLVATALVLAEVQNRLAVPLLVVDGGVREGALLELRLAAAA
jgi:exopolyphosphatase/pppGpp-phosphohydrolase